MDLAAQGGPASACGGLVPPYQPIPLDHYLKRPEITWSDIVPHEPELAGVSREVALQVEYDIKYAGYIARQDKQIERFAKMEARLIPATIDYAKVTGLRNEARQKLGQFTPRSLGQALRISGITPADVTVLAVHLHRSNTG